MTATPISSLQQHQSALLKLLVEFDRVCRVLEIPYVLFAGTLLGAVRHQGFIPWDDDLDVLMLREDYQRFLAQAEGILNREEFFLQKEFSSHWPLFFSKLRLNGTACLEKYHPKDPSTHQGIYIDIFPCDRAAATEMGRKLQFFASKVVIAKSLDARGYDTDSRGKKLFMALCRLLPAAPFLALTRRGRADSPLVHTFLAGARSYHKNVFPRSWLEQRSNAVFSGLSFPVPGDWDALLHLLYGDYMTLPPPEERQLKQHALVVDTLCSWENYLHYRDGMDFTVHTRSIR